MANNIAKKKDGKTFKFWNQSSGNSLDSKEEMMFLVKNKGVMFDPDCSWRAIVISREGETIEGDYNSTLLYNIIYEDGKIVDAMDLNIVSKEEFERDYQIF